VPVICNHHINTNHLSYGPKGAAIIRSTLLRFLGPSMATQYIVVPYVACHLISEDMGCSMVDALEIMVNSAGAGVSLHPEDDNHDDYQDILSLGSHTAMQGD
jgi:hypothetical protein